MTSAELRRMVDVMTPDVVESIRDDLRFDAYPEDIVTASVELYGHADALVALVEACERWKACTAKGFGSCAEHDLQDALARIHAVKAVI